MFNTGSYAAVPHIVRLGMLVGEHLDTNYFLLSTVVEIGRLQSRGPEIPADLADVYFDALRGLHEIAHACASAAWDEARSRAITAALIVSKGHGRLAEVILELTPEVMTSVLVEAGVELEEKEIRPLA